MAEIPEPAIPHPRLAPRVYGHTRSFADFAQAFRQANLHHAWLVGGPQGVGKASLVYQMLRMLLSGQAADAADPAAPYTEIRVTPGLESQIAALSHPDIRVLERLRDEKTGQLKKEISVEQVRELQGFLGLTAGFGGWRVVVIDSIDELNRNAANALLKILEEPPQQTILFLVSHQPRQLLPTLRSRCRQLMLQPLGDAEMLRLSQQHPVLSPVASESVRHGLELAEGRPGRLIELVAGQALSIHDDLRTILAADAVSSTEKILAFAERLADKSNPVAWTYFCEFMLKELKARTRNALKASAQSGDTSTESGTSAHRSSPSPLEVQLDLWDKLSTVLRDAERLNLDRKQVVLSSLMSLRGAS